MKVIYEIPAKVAKSRERNQEAEAGYDFFNVPEQ